MTPDTLIAILSFMAYLYFPELDRQEQKDGKTFFVFFTGPPGCGKTQSALLELVNETRTVYIVDPFEEMTSAIVRNLSGLTFERGTTMHLVKSVQELPADMSGCVLVIDDGRGWFSLAEKDFEPYSPTSPDKVICTVQTGKTVNEL